mgnify:CR=1 FL=1
MQVLLNWSQYAGQLDSNNWILPWSCEVSPFLLKFSHINEEEIICNSPNTKQCDKDRIYPCYFRTSVCQYDRNDNHEITRCPQGQHLLKLGCLLFKWDLKFVLIFAEGNGLIWLPGQLISSDASKQSAMESHIRDKGTQPFNLHWK